MTPRADSAVSPRATGIIDGSGTRVHSGIRDRTGALRPAPLWLATFLAVIGGVVLAGAFPQLGWWPLAFLGTPLVLYTLVGRRIGGSLLVGLLAGFAFWGTHISWLTIYLGAVPWLALAGLESIFFAIGAALIALAWRFGDTLVGRSSTGRGIGWLRLGVVPFVVAGVWTLREFVTSTWPYGGFSWGRLAFSQSESPFGDLVAWVGISGLSFLIAWVSALIVQAARTRAAPRRVIRSLMPIALLGAMLLTPTFAVTIDATARIGAVQGDADAGLFAAYERGEILQDHLRATEPLVGESMDLLVWPENASDLNPLEYPQAAIALDQVTADVGAALITGAVTAVGDDIFNSVLLWREGEGVADQYDKIHPVPFAEYIPDRDFWFPLAPDLLSLIPRDYTVGTRDNVFATAGENGSGVDIRAGIAICFDIVDDSLVRTMIADGANVIVAPTNNADFGRSDESVQQLAIARLRAIETGRSVVNASTVGTSAIIAPDGSTLDALPTFEPGTMLQDVPLSTTTTPSTVIGQGLEIVLSLLGLAGVVLLGLSTIRGSTIRGSTNRLSTARGVDTARRTSLDERNSRG